MQKKLFFIGALQVTCVIVFTLLALSCQSTTPVVTNPTYERAPYAADCEKGNYLYIGKTDELKAAAVVNANNLTTSCKDEKTGRYFAK